MNNINKLALSVLLMTITIVLLSCQESKEERFEREAREFTQKNCPRAEFEDLIFLDSLVYHNDGTNDYKHCYSVKGDSAMLAEIDNQHEQLHERLLTAVRNSVDMRHVKDAGLNIMYVYYNAESHQKIAEFRFTPDDYR